MKTCRGLCPVLVLIVLAGLPSRPGLHARETPAPLPPLNEKVVAFARTQLGRKVGNGECTSLAIEALRAAGARHHPLGRRGGDYVWGTPVGAAAEAKPGDILQFRDAVFKGKQRFSGGRWISWHQEYAHHTAIVGEVRMGGKVLVILQQNVGSDDAGEDRKKTVQETTLRMDSLQKGGWVRIYRPVPREEGGDATGPFEDADGSPGG